MLPTFIVIGAMKCGTTSLYYYLDEHPDIGMSMQKETDFFIDEHGNWERGVEWYRSMFPQATARGECSPNYTKRHLFSKVPERIREVCPNAKFIYLVRDPIERTISHYMGSRMQGRISIPFDEVVASPGESNHVLTSCYYRQLKPYLEVFSRDQLLVVQNEKLRSDPVATMRRIYRFLGVDAMFINKRINTHFNKGTDKKKRAAWFRWISSRIPQRWKDYWRLYLPLQWLPGTSVQRPTLEPEVVEKLLVFFRPEVKKLQRLTGQPFSAWRKPSTE